MDDHELLRDYLEDRSERAFAALVERHLPLVYATALRLVHDPSAAEDIAQTVIINLARQAWRVRPRALTGWLYNAAKFAAVDHLRREGRRRQRETEAMKLAEPDNHAVVSWEQLAPLVDDALAQLNSIEQNAILLRYFDGQSMSETGRRLALSEPATQKRVSRALEKMRAHFARQGVTASTALLATTLGTQAATPPPAGLAGKITGPSLAGAAGQAGSAGIIYLLLRILSMSTKTKITLTVATVAALIAFTAVGIWWYTQPASAPPKVAFAPTNFKSPIDPKSPALHPPPSPPLVLPPPKSLQPLVSEAAPQSADPQVELNSAIDDLLNQLTATYKTALVNNQDILSKKMTTDIQTQATVKDVQSEILLMQSLKGQTPVYNADYTGATYKNVTDPLTDEVVDIGWLKINGQWVTSYGLGPRN